MLGDVQQYPSFRRNEEQGRGVQSTKDVVVTWGDRSPAHVKLVVIAAAAAAVTFLSHTFKVNDSAGEEDGWLLADNVALSSIHLSKHYEGVAVALCPDGIEDDLANEWAASLLGEFQALETILVYDCIVGERALMALTDGGSHNSSEVVKVVMSSAVSDELSSFLLTGNGISQLNPPVLLSGASAAVVSHCECQGLAAVCLAAFMSHSADCSPSQAFLQHTTPFIEKICGHQLIRESDQSKTLGTSTSSSTSTSTSDIFVSRTEWLYT
jgi:hypothetical protein